MALVFTAERETSGTFPFNQPRSIVRRFEARWDSFTATPNEVINAVASFHGITYGQPHPTYTIIFMRTPTATQRSIESGQGSWWDVEFLYESGDQEDPEDIEDPAIHNPLNDPPDINWTTQQQEFAMFADAGDPPQPMTKTNGRPYDPPMTDWRPVFVVQYSRNEASVGFASHGQYINKVNTTVWNGAAIGHALCASIQARRLFSTIDVGGVPTTIVYWNVVYEFRYIEEAPPPATAGRLDPGPWDFAILQADTMHIPTGAANPIPIRVNAYPSDANFGDLDNGPHSVPVRGPHPIDADGQAIPTNLLPGAAVYKGHYRKFGIDFTPLGIVF